MGLALAQLVSRNSSPEALGKEIRAYAKRYGAPGTPEYSAALRKAIAAAADALHDKSDANAPDRRINLSKPPKSFSAGTREVDRDERYSSWLESKADYPFAPLNVDGCGSIGMRAVGGEIVTSPECFPEVSLIFGDQSKDYCSGVLIYDQKTILTAGHCVCAGRINHVIFGNDLASIKRWPAAVAGSAIAHEGIKCEGNGVSRSEYVASLAGRDIAILRLVNDVPLEIAKSVPLPSADQAETLFAAGNKTLWLWVMAILSWCPVKRRRLRTPKRRHWLQPESSAQTAQEA